MILIELGSIVINCWNEIPDHFPFTRLDEFIIMPNHVHGIIIIDHNKKIDLSNNVGDENFRPLQHKTNLSNIIKGFKIGVTKWCRDNHYDNFKWQRSFYDRIIRTEIELFNIRKFVRENPLRWDIDNNIDNLDL